MAKEEVIKLKKPETPPTKPSAGEKLPENIPTVEYDINRRIIPAATSTVGRSLKLRDLFSISGAVACDATVVGPITAADSSGNETDLKSFRLFGNELHVGMMIRITALGVITDDGTRTAKFRIGSGLAPTTEWNSMTSTAATATNAPWHLTWYGVVASLGATGTIEGQMVGKINNVNKDDPNTAAITINTTTNLTIALTVDWDGTDAGNSVSVREWLVEVIR